MRVWLRLPGSATPTAHVSSVDARTLEQAEATVGELRREARQDTVVVALALVSALLTTQVRPAVVLPALVVGVAFSFLAARASFRRFQLLDRLAADRDAYAIREIRSRGVRASSMKNRRMLAASIRRMPGEPGVALETRITVCRDELERLADELDRPELTLDAFAAVACERLLSDGGESPLFNPALPVDSLISRLRQIRVGFEPRSPHDPEHVLAWSEMPPTGGRLSSRLRATCHGASSPSSPCTPARRR